LILSVVTAFATQAAGAQVQRSLTSPEARHAARPDISTAVKHKIDVMNARWRDYDWLFAMPNR
jgi:hypothetical protein